jgi:type I restriction enzyme S subunit
MSKQSHWRQARVGDILKIRNGYAAKSSDYSQEGIPLIRQSDINDETIDISTAKRVPARVMEECGQYLVRKGDLLIGMSGSLGKIGRYVDEEVAIQNQRTGLLQVKPGFTSGFAKLVLHFVEPQIIAEGKGVAVQNVSAKEIEDCMFPLPPEAERERIVAEIEKQFTRLDAGVASLKRVQIALKRYRASVLKAACEGRLVPTEAELALKQNRSYETGEQLLQRMLKQRREKWNGKSKYKEPRAPESPPDRPLPDGWFWTGFEQLSDGSKNAIKAGPFGSSLRKSFYTPSGFKIYGQEQVINGDPYFGDYFVSRELFEQLQSCEVRPGDILISLVGTAGKVLILPEDCAPGIINPRLLKLSLNRSDLNAKFIKILLESATTRAFFKLAAHGGTMEILNLGILKSLPIPLPPRAEQTRIVAEVERRTSVIEELETVTSTELQRAIRLRQSILQQALNGGLTHQPKHVHMNA